MKIIVTVATTLARLFMAGALLAATPAYAGKTYTPAELHRMINAGKYPKQGPVKEQVRELGYATCINTMDQIIGAMKPHYPSALIVSTNTMRTEKVWTNDGAVTVTCSAANDKLIMTVAPYE